MIADNLSVQHFEGLNKKLYVSATDIIQGCSVCFDSGDLIAPVAASAAVPLMFSPVNIDGKLYVDGGVLNNFPVEPLIENCNFIIGSNVSTFPENHNHWTPFLVLQRSFLLAINQDFKNKQKHCHVLIDPPVGHLAAFTKSRLHSFFQTGYENTMAVKDLILKKYHETA